MDHHGPALFYEKGITLAATMFQGRFNPCERDCGRAGFFINEIGWLAWLSDRKVRHFVAACWGFLL
jgi:hypothetical protein